MPPAGPGREATLGEDIAWGREAAGVQAVGEVRDISSVEERWPDDPHPPVTSNIWVEGRRWWHKDSC